MSCFDLSLHRDSLTVAQRQVSQDVRRYTQHISITGPIAWSDAIEVFLSM